MHFQGPRFSSAKLILANIQVIVDFPIPCEVVRPEDALNLFVHQPILRSEEDLTHCPLRALMSVECRLASSVAHTVEQGEVHCCQLVGHYTRVDCKRGTHDWPITFSCRDPVARMSNTNNSKCSSGGLEHEPDNPSGRHARLGHHPYPHPGCHLGTA